MEEREHERQGPVGKLQHKRDQIRLDHLQALLQALRSAAHDVCDLSPEALAGSAVPSMDDSSVAIASANHVSASAPSLRHWAADDCDVRFEPKSSRQKYCPEHGWLVKYEPCACGERKTRGQPRCMECRRREAAQARAVPKDDDYVTLGRAAVLLQVTPPSIRHLIEQGHLQAIANPNDGRSKLVRVSDLAPFTQHRSPGGFLPQQCVGPECQRSFMPTSPRQKYCPGHIQVCKHPDCTEPVKNFRKGSLFCRRHVASDRTYAERSCENDICRALFVPRSGNQRFCEACMPTAPRYRCERCGGRRSRGDVDLCQTCRREEDELEFVRQMVRGTHPQYKLDALSRPIATWMEEQGYGFPQAAEVLKWPVKRLRWEVYRRLENPEKPGSIQPKKLAELASRLGEVSALGWDADRWWRELRAARPDGAPETLKSVWPDKMVSGITEKTPFQKALRDRLVELGLERDNVAEIVGESPSTVTCWLTRGKKQPAQPQLHQVGNIARLWATSGADLEQLETVMRHLCKLIYNRMPSDAGLLIMRKLAQRRLAKLEGYTVAWLGGAGVKRATSRLIWEGRARPYIQRRVAERLELSPEDRNELFSRSEKPDEHGVEVMRVRKRFKKQRKETQEGAWQKLDAACEHLIAKRKVRGGRLSPYTLRDYTGCKLDTIEYWWDNHGLALFGHICRVPKRGDLRRLAPCH